MAKEAHVLPKNDLIEHLSKGTDCICGPDIKLVPSAVSDSVHTMVVHHSLDGREQFE